jgi:hypothetical protein
MRRRNRWTRKVAISCDDFNPVEFSVSQARQATELSWGLHVSAETSLAVWPNEYGLRSDPECSASGARIAFSPGEGVKRGRIGACGRPRGRA